MHRDPITCKQLAAAIRTATRDAGHSHTCPSVYGPTRRGLYVVVLDVTKASLSRSPDWDAIRSGIETLIDKSLAGAIRVGPAGFRTNPRRKHTWRATVHIRPLDRT